MFSMILATTSQDASLHRVPTRPPNVRSGILAVALTLAVTIGAMVVMRRVRRLLQ
jgi:hypothetical protein